MINKKSFQQGFTIIELLIVVVAISMFAALAMINLSNSRLKARDNKRVFDVKQVQIALDLFYDKHGAYPALITPNRPLLSLNGAEIFMRSIPTNPKPWDDNECANSDYVYNSIDNGADYELIFCLGSKSGNVSAGKHIANDAGIE